MGSVSLTVQLVPDGMPLIVCELPALTETLPLKPVPQSYPIVNGPL